MATEILIFRTDSIGELIVTCPVIITIKKYFNNSKITIITSNKNYEYAKSLDIFDKIHEFPNNNIINKIKFMYKLSKKKFDYIFIFDGKDRSIFSASLIKSNYKVAVRDEKKISIINKLFNIKFVKNSNKSNVHDIFQELLNYCKINTNIKNYDFLKIKKNNNFLSKIPIKNYLHIHLDEKWFKNLYINSYSDINPSYNDFVDFVKNLAIKNNVLITTGIIDFDLIQNLKIKFFQKKTDNIYLKNYSNTSVYFIYMPTFNDIESLLRNAKILITCHGAVTHAANSFNVKIVDIIEENRKVFYQHYTSYLKKYNPIYRAKFDILKDDLLDIIRE